jgi:hypothetical protein
MEPAIRVTVGERRKLEVLAVSASNGRASRNPCFNMESYSKSGFTT